MNFKSFSKNQSAIVGNSHSFHYRMYPFQPLERASVKPMKLEKVDSLANKPFRKLNIDSIEANNNNSSDSSSSKSDDDDEDDDAHQFLKSHPNESGTIANLPPKFEFNLKQFDNLDASFPSELKEMMQYVPKYTPQNIDIDYKLQVFIPEFIPSVGDSDAMVIFFLDTNQHKILTYIYFYPHTFKVENYNTATAGLIC